MKKQLLFIAALLIFSLSTQARDDKEMYDAKSVIERGISEGIFDNSVSFYFGTSPHPKAIKTLGSVRSNKKTNAFNKTDKEACDWAFLSVIKAMHAQAKKVGADSIINIRSNYRNIQVIDNSRFQCGAGAFIAGTALIGDMIKTQ